MKTLVATKEGQGARKNDFSWADEGEFVGFPFECDGERVDGSCGCRRSFSGFRTHKGTTTAKVVEMPVTPMSFARSYRESMRRAGWIKPGDTDTDWVDRGALELMALAGKFPVGAIVEKRGCVVQERTPGVKGGASCRV